MGWLKTAVLALVLTVPLPGLAVGDQQDSVLRITNGEWPPYLGRDEPGYGIASRIVTRAFERAGYEVSYEFHPWSRSLYLARKGQRDGTAVWLPSDKRREDFFISQPVIVTEYVFFHRAGMPFDWQVAADLAGYRIGLTRDYEYGQVIDQVKDRRIAHTEMASSDELNLRKLMAGRIDLFPVDPVVGQRMVNGLFSDDEARKLTWHPRSLRNDRLHLLLSRKVAGNAERMEAFNRELKAMRQEGEVQRILVDALGNHITGMDRLKPDEKN